MIIQLVLPFWITFTTAVIITTDLLTNTNKGTLEKDNILEELEYFQFLATDQRQEWQYGQHAKDLETKNSTMLGSDFYLDKNTCSLTALALSPSVLFLFHFVLSQNNLKIISTQLFRKMAHACTLWRKYEPCFELPEKSVLRLHKALTFCRACIPFSFQLVC